MNPNMMARIIAVVPERSARFLSGTPFGAAGESPYAAQMQCLASLLNWLSPLSTLTEEQQRVLGVAALHGKLGRRDDEDEDEDRDDPLASRSPFRGSPFG